MQTNSIDMTNRTPYTFTVDASPAISTAPADRLNALLAPALSTLAEDLGTTTADLAEWLSSPELTDKLAALITNLEALEHLRALAARAPAITACRALLTTDDPIEQRRVAATLLRTPIHTPRHAQRTHQPAPQRTRSASKRSDPHPPSLSARPSPSINPRQSRPHKNSNPSSLSLLLAPDATPAPAASPAHTLPLGGMPAAPSQHAPQTPPNPPSPARPGVTATAPLDFPLAPTLHRRTPPSRAASLLHAASSTPPPSPRPP